jgi:hypothetical protein
MRFCLYLYEERLLTQDEFVQAIKALNDRTPPIGRLAVRTGVLKLADLRILLARQAEAPLPLARLAVAEGMLDEAQLQELVDHQRRATPSEQDVIMELKLLPNDVVKQAYRRFVSLMI